MELRDALCQISEIRQHMARSEVFRGYRSLTVGFSGMLALAAAALQPKMIPSPQGQLRSYLTLWVSVAILSIFVSGIEMWWRARASQSAMTRQKTLHAVEQFLPCVIVGALLTICIFLAAPDVAWMLPGLWSLVFALGVFASRRVLPKQILYVGLYYVFAGVGCLLWCQGESALSPWLMGISFGGGQLLAAVVLYWTLERSDVSQT